MLGNISFIDPDYIHESHEMRSIVASTQNGHHTMFGLPFIVPIAFLSVLPDVNGYEFGTAKGLEISVASHIIRTWYVGMEVLSRVFLYYLPDVPITPEFISIVSAGLLTHDIGKGSIFDKLVRNTTRFTNDDEKKKVVREHTLFPFKLVRELIILSTYGKDYSKLIIDDVAKLSNTARHQKHNHAIIYGSTLHHMAVENSPTMEFLLENGFITPHTSQVIYNQLQLNHTNPRAALLNMLSDENHIQGIAIGASFITIPDVGDSILSQTRLYQSKDMDRGGVLKTVLLRGFEPQFVDVVHEVMCELYEDPQILHKRAMTAFKQYIQNIMAPNSKTIIGFSGLLKRNMDIFLRIVDWDNPVDEALPLYIENGK